MRLIAYKLSPLSLNNGAIAYKLLLPPPRAYSFPIVDITDKSQDYGLAELPPVETLKRHLKSEAGGRLGTP